MKIALPNSRAEILRNPLTLPASLLALLACALLLLALRLGSDLRAIGGAGQSDLRARSLQLRNATLQSQNLHGIFVQLSSNNVRLDNFEHFRLPAAYSSVATRLGQFQTQTGVQLSHLQYNQQKPESGVAEIEIDAEVGGSYPQIMQLVNALERDPLFFVIRSMTLNSQQGGQVSLRMRLSTWLRVT